MGSMGMKWKKTDADRSELAREQGGIALKQRDHARQLCRSEGAGTFMLACGQCGQWTVLVGDPIP